jgi:hypothetical protein
MEFTGTTVITVVDGMIAEEVGLDGVTALQQLGLIPRRDGATSPWSACDSPFEPDAGRRRGRAARSALPGTAAARNPT